MDKKRLEIDIKNIISHHDGVPIAIINEAYYIQPETASTIFYEFGIEPEQGVIYEDIKSIITFINHLMS
jgi:hypothetical protein